MEDRGTVPHFRVPSPPLVTVDGAQTRGRPTTEEVDVALVKGSCDGRRRPSALQCPTVNEQPRLEAVGSEPVGMQTDDSIPPGDGYLPNSVLAVIPGLQGNVTVPHNESAGRTRKNVGVMHTVPGQDGRVTGTSPLTVPPNLASMGSQSRPRPVSLYAYEKSSSFDSATLAHGPVGSSSSIPTGASRSCRGPRQYSSRAGKGKLGMQTLSTLVSPKQNSDTFEMSRSGSFTNQHSSGDFGHMQGAEPYEKSSRPFFTHTAENQVSQSSRATSAQAAQQGKRSTRPANLDVCSNPLVVSPKRDERERSCESRGGPLSSYTTSTGSRSRSGNPASSTASPTFRTSHASGSMRTESRGDGEMLPGQPLQLPVVFLAVNDLKGSTAAHPLVEDASSQCHSPLGGMFTSMASGPGTNSTSVVGTTSAVSKAETLRGAKAVLRKHMQQSLSSAAHLMSSKARSFSSKVAPGGAATHSSSPSQVSSSIHITPQQQQQTSSLLNATRNPSQLSLSPIPVPFPPIVPSSESSTATGRGVISSQLSFVRQADGQPEARGFSKTVPLSNTNHQLSMRSGIRITEPSPMRKRAEDSTRPFELPAFDFVGLSVLSRSNSEAELHGSEDLVGVSEPRRASSDKVGLLSAGRSRSSNAEKRRRGSTSAMSAGQAHATATRAGEVWQSHGHLSDVDGSSNASGMVRKPSVPRSTSGASPRRRTKESENPRSGSGSPLVTAPRQRATPLRHAPSGDTARLTVSPHSRSERHFREFTDDGPTGSTDSIRLRTATPNDGTKPHLSTPRSKKSGRWSTERQPHPPRGAGLRLDSRCESPYVNGMGAGGMDSGTLGFGTTRSLQTPTTRMGDAVPFSRASMNSDYDAQLRNGTPGTGARRNNSRRHLGSQTRNATDEPHFDQAHYYEHDHSNSSSDSDDSIGRQHDENFKRVLASLQQPSLRSNAQKKEDPEPEVQFGGWMAAGCDLWFTLNAVKAGAAEKAGGTVELTEPSGESDKATPGPSATPSGTPPSSVSGLEKPSATAEKPGAGTTA